MAITITINRVVKDLPVYTVEVEITAESTVVLQTEAGINIIKER